ncbi:MAG: C10 family peptidase [Candidatus Cloacimonetes bacterium]|nr:C10 family peptidase [Candidatus Cloacimonadota bacterium]
MKRICALVFLFALTGLLFAEPVTSVQAMGTAIDWFTHASGQISSEATVNAWPGNTGSHLWLVSFDGGGFVILPSDDAAWPILAWDAQAAAPATIDHPGLLSMLRGYTRQLESIAEAGLGNEQTRPAWDAIQRHDFSAWPLTRDVAPLLSTTWNQDWPYNADCPADNQGPGGHAYAGCGATTMAQIMKFWAHPETGTGQHSYNHPDYGAISADFAAATYNWSLMPNNVTAYNAEVAEILFHTGVSMDMDYGPDGSGAYSSDVVFALPTYFSYQNSVQLVEKDNYTTTIWNQMMRGELDNGRPIFYAGYGDYGHAFVMDGYQGTDHFHFNFGWSGSYNGYYYLTNINPSNYQFNDDQEAIIGIQPATGGNDGDPPYNLTAQVQNEEDVHLHWSMPTGGGDVLRWDSGENGSAVGLGGTGGVFIVAARFTAAELTPFDGMSLSQIEIYANDEAPLVLKVYTGGSWTGAAGDSGAEVLSQPLTGLTWEAFNTIDLDTPITIDASQELWFGYEVDDPGDGVFPAGCDGGPSINYFGNLIYNAGAWASLYDLASTLNYNWNLGGFVSDDRGRLIPLTHTPEPLPVCWNSDFAATSPGNDTQPNAQRLTRDLTGFRIYRDGVLIDILNTPGARDYDDEGLDPGVYEYYVTAMYNDTQESVPSNIAEAIIISDNYPPPENLQYSLTDDDVILDWDEPGGGGGTTEELIYDNDTVTGGYSYVGYSMGTQMSPQGPCQVITLKYYTTFQGGGNTFNAEVFNWQGAAPGATLLHTETATAADDDWMEIDVSAANIQVDGDFMVAFGSVIQTVYLGYDANLNNGRSWDYDPGGPSWVPWNQAYHIRAVVQYPDGAVRELRPVVPSEAHPGISSQSCVSKHGYERRRFIDAAANRVPPRNRPAIDHYNIYQDGALIGATPPTTTFYITPLPMQNTEFYVTAYYDDGGESVPSNSVNILDVDNNTVPGYATGLTGNFPNPFNPSTTVQFSLSSPGLVELTIFNTRGQLVCTLLRQNMSAGEHEAVWDGDDDAGAPVASGIYFCRMTSADYASTRKMILLK